jgi:hypothetical protein
MEKEKEEIRDFYRKEFEKSFIEAQINKTQIIKEQQEWLKESRKLLEQRLKEKELEKKELRDQYSNLQNELEKQHLMNIEQKRQAKMQYKQQLDDLQKRYQELKLAEREWENQQPKNTSIPNLSDKSVMSSEDWLQHKKKLSQELQDQIRQRIEALRTRSSEEKEYIDHILMKEMEKIEKDTEQALQRRKQTREKMRKEWEQSLLDSSRKKIGILEKREKDFHEREEKEMNIQQEIKEAMKQHIQYIRERNKEIKEQIQSLALQKLKSMEENKELQKQMAEKWKNTEVRKKLFRCSQTGRLLPPEQFNLFVK